MLRQLKAANIARQKFWENGLEFDMLYHSNATMGEIGEAINVLLNSELSQLILGMVMAGKGGNAANIVKKLVRQDKGAVGSRAQLDDLAGELADIIIYIDLLATKAGIDLEKAIVDKFNQTSRKLNFDVFLHMEEN